MQTICYNSVMNWVRRQLMRPSATATPAGAAPHRCAANSFCASAALRDENSSRTSRTLREIKTTCIWDDWNTNGEVVAHYDYSPFGEPLVASGPLAATFTHQFSTKPYCPVTGFSEYQMRKYRPEIGRWMSRDHAGHLGGYNLFSFVRNCPCSQGDLLGLAETNPYKTEYYEVVGPYYQLDTQLGADEWGTATAVFTYRFRKGNIHKKTKQDCLCSEGYRWTVTYKREVEFYASQHKIRLPQWKDYEYASVDEKKAWDDMIKALTAHEEHHIEIYNTFNSLVIFEGTGTDCLYAEALKAAQRELMQKVENEYKSRLASAEAKSAKFDEDTDHGVKNGVVLPQI